MLPPHKSAHESSLPCKCYNKHTFPLISHAAMPAIRHKMKQRLTVPKCNTRGRLSLGEGHIQYRMPIFWPRLYRLFLHINTLKMRLPHETLPWAKTELNLFPAERYRSQPERFAGGLKITTWLIFEKKKKVSTQRTRFFKACNILETHS